MSRRSNPLNACGTLRPILPYACSSVDILPFKTCSLDCVYCQLGTQPKTTVRRSEFIPARAVLAQIRKAVASGQKIDAITFSGSGEPTLNSGIGTIIRGIKRFTRIPVVVLTAKDLTATDRERLAGSVTRIVQKGAHDTQDSLRKACSLVLAATRQPRAAG